MIAAIRNYGVQYTSEKLPETDFIPANAISPYVIREGFKVYSQAILVSKEYQKSLADLARVGYSHYHGPSPKINPRSVHEYLSGHSIRKGALGKLAGITHRIIDYTKGLMWGNSDKIRAVNTIKNLILDVEGLTNPGKLFSESDDLEAKKKAELLLNNMLTHYNSYCV
jgi:hypothetical protein